MKPIRYPTLYSSPLRSSFIVYHSFFIVLFSLPALAQTTPKADRPASSAESGRTEQIPSSDQPAKPLSTLELMQESDGSLMQAEAAQPSPDGSKKAIGYVDLYAVAPQQPHVLKKHDLVNIVVNEQSKSQNSGTSDQERQVDFDAKVDAFVKLELAKFSVQGAGEGANPPEVKLEGQRDFKATGEYDRTDTMTTRLEAEVIDVKPNGTIVLQARRHLKIDEEEINVSLTGTCKVDDIDASNSVLSTQLLDLDLQKSTKGEVHDTNKRGLLHRLLDFIGPF